MRHLTSHLRFRPAGLIVIPVLLALSCQLAIAHKQIVHQYIVREAYLLLMASAGNNIRELPAHIGDYGSYYTADSAWQRAFITTGAWREDEEDPVYHYDIYNGLNYALVSITHFWDADQGDFTENMFRLRYQQPPLPPIIDDIGPYPNAYKKIRDYAYGGWVLWYPRTILCQNAANEHYLIITPLPIPVNYGIPISYDTLTTFYNSKTCRLHSDQTDAIEIFDINDLKIVSASSVPVLKGLDNDTRDHIAWEVLGRMCHLLGDMSVPAHAHRDEHGLSPDSYENYMGGPTSPDTVWNHGNVGSPIILDSHWSTDDVLHFLMYVTQQQSDHFGSNGPDQGAGNDNLSGNPRPPELGLLNALPYDSLGQPTTEAGPWTTDNLNHIRDKTFPFEIRATAGLLYWFCRTTGLMDGLTTGVKVAGPFLPRTAALAQNFPNPFNPTTVIGYRVPGLALVTLKVYDVLGREVATLVNEEQGPGSYTVRFDGSRLSSGMYVYRMQAGSFVQAKTLLLLK
jgi:hypothetical protein